MWVSTEYTEFILNLNFLWAYISEIFNILSYLIVMNAPAVMGLSHPQSEKCHRRCLFAAASRPFPSCDITHKVLQKEERFHSHVCLSPTFIHDGEKTAEWRWRTGAVAAKTQLSGLLCAC